MGLSFGAKLGPYEIVSPLGAGGMGEVYRARDTRLDRTVAIKVLNSALVASPDMKARFEREARAISQLQHPHICVLYDVGYEGGTDFLVMEYLEGETLAERLKRGALPLDQVIRIGGEIADALDKAHKAGIVHRDLKPGNVMLTSSGAKLLDFGLAKPAGMAAAAPSGTAPLLSAAVTVTSPSPHSPLTQQGSIVGTVQYMSPEQIEGREADARSDIFALGAVLYEMATGKRAFEGKSQLSVASAILDKDPEPVSAVQQSAPAALDHVISTCLAKSPEERFQSARDVALQLRWTATKPQRAVEASSKSNVRRRLAFATIGIIGLIAAAVAGYWLNGRVAGNVVRGEIATPDKMVWDFGGDFAGPPMLSPDGEKIVFTAHTADSPRQLWVRPTNSFSAQKLDGTEDASFPFWSPDGRSIGFFADGKLKKVPASGGPVAALADAPNPRGGSWGVKDDILMTAGIQHPISRVSASGGAAIPVTKLDTAKHTTHRWPWFLPDGKHFLYLASNHGGGDPTQNGIYYASLDGAENRLIVATDSMAQYANGYLLYHAQNSLVAQPFDWRSGKLSGEPVMVVDKVRQDSGVWRSTFSVSQNGLLIYQPTAADTPGTQLVWHDTSGKTTPLTDRATFQDARLSPDGSKIAVSYGDPARQIWIIDVQRGTKLPLTFDAGLKSAPAWSPDGKYIVYQAVPSAVSPEAQIWIKPANGSGTAQKLATTVAGGGIAYPELSRDGQYLVYVATKAASGGVGRSLEAVRLSGDRTPFTVVPAASPQSSIMEFDISPNSRWVAYVSSETGRLAVYVTAFPHQSGKWLVASDIGSPLWSRDGRKIYFRRLSDDSVYECDLTEKSDEIEFGQPKALFRTTLPPGRSFDVSDDGKRFLVVETQADTSTSLKLVVNWPAELKK